MSDFGDILNQAIQSSEGEAGRSESQDALAAEDARSQELRLRHRDERWAIIWRQYPLLRAGISQFTQALPALNGSPNARCHFPEVKIDLLDAIIDSRMDEYEQEQASPKAVEFLSAYGYSPPAFATFGDALRPWFAVLGDGRWYVAYRGMTGVVALPHKDELILLSEITSPEALFSSIEEIYSESLPEPLWQPAQERLWSMEPEEFEKAFEPKAHAEGLVAAAGGKALSERW